MQRQVIKLAFGWQVPYSEICKRYGITTLKQRRIDIIDRFVAKAVNNERFRDTWFPLREQGGPEVRDKRIFRETCARTSRYYNSPLAYMRWRANDLLTA